MKDTLKRLVKSHYRLYQLYNYALLIARKTKSRLIGGNLLDNQGCAIIQKDIIGKENIIIIKKGAILHHPHIRIRGNHNKLIVEEDCVIGPNCSFWMEGNNIKISIGKLSTFTHSVHFCAQEDGMSITVGNGCMFSNQIIVRTSDSHPIYNQDGQRINEPASIVIGNQVWVAPDTKIMKGAKIGDGSIIGSDSMVGSNPIPSNSLAVGHPAKVVKTNIIWSREQLFFQ